MGGSGENGLRSQATEPFPLLSQRGKCSVAVEKMVHSHDCNWLYFGCKVCVSWLFTVRDWSNSIGGGGGGPEQRGGGS